LRHDNYHQNQKAFTVPIGTSTLLHLAPP
jgi:hypothetical protein